MKKLISVTVLLTFLTASMFAQESSVESDIEPPQSSVVPTGSQLILYDKFYVVTYPWAFRFFDGSTLSYSRLKENLALVPENGKLIRRADTWNVLYYVALGATAGLLGGAIYGVIDGGSPQSAGTNMLFVGAAITSGLGLSASNLLWQNLTKAIGNYNLSVLGAPAVYR